MGSVVSQARRTDAGACLYEEGGTVSGFARDCAIGFLDFHDVIHSRKAIKTARDTNL